DGETGAHLTTKPGPDGAGPGPGAGALLQGGAHSEHGPCGPGDHHGGAADLQTAQETGVCVCAEVHVLLLCDLLVLLQKGPDDRLVLRCPSRWLGGGGGGSGDSKTSF